MSDEKMTLDQLLMEKVIRKEADNLAKRHGIKNHVFGIRKKNSYQLLITCLSRTLLGVLEIEATYSISQVMPFHESVGVCLCDRMLLDMRELIIDKAYNDNIFISDFTTCEGTDEK